jgi:hypothetical protein
MRCQGGLRVKERARSSLATCDAAEQRPAEADGKAQHLEAQPPGHPVVPELVHRDQKAHGHDKPQSVPGEIHA